MGLYIDQAKLIVPKCMTDSCNSHFLDPLVALIYMLNIISYYASMS